MTVENAIMLFQVSLPCLCLCMMDVNNGGGEVIRGLPCVKRLNQVCWKYFIEKSLDMPYRNLLCLLL